MVSKVTILKQDVHCFSISLDLLVLVCRHISPFNFLLHNIPKWSDTLKILQQMMQDFYSVSDHFATLCIKGLILSQLERIMASITSEIRTKSLVF